MKEEEERRRRKKERKKKERKKKEVYGIYIISVLPTTVVIGKRIMYNKKKRIYLSDNLSSGTSSI